MSYDLTQFSLGDMLRCGTELRQACASSSSMEAAADRVCRMLYDGCCSDRADAHQCVLVRFYKTHAYGDLPLDLQRFAARSLESEDEIRDDTKCLTLLATAGEDSAWNSRRRSRAHQAIPLVSTQLVERAPMIAQLIREFGLDVASVVEPAPGVSAALDGRTYGIFYVGDAKGSPYIPAQREFVERHGVQSVVGFGGSLRTGDLFATILFTRIKVPRECADRFRNVALDVKSGLFSLAPTRVFADEVPV